MADNEARCVLITGVAQGIGAATATAFRAAGWRTIGVDLHPPAASDGLDRFIAADLADPVAITQVAASLTEHEGRLDALVNNAAVQVCKPLAETTLADWERVMAVNLRAPFWLIHETLPLLTRSAGAIVNVSSVHAIATSTSICAYATSKGALAAMTRAAALELGPAGVRINAVLPGAVETPMLRDGLARGHAGDGGADAQLAALAAAHPMGRVAQPAEIARAILYLADSEQSSFVTGASHVVDGGVTVRLSTE